MKYLILLLAFSFAKYQPAKNAMNDKNYQKIRWLIGSWKQTNSVAGMSGSETWALSNNEMKGLGITMKGVDTVAMEKLKIISKNDTLYYVADVKENNALVYFKFTELTGNGFVCENPEHDFPKKISYQFSPDTKKLKATISGNGKSIGYLYEK